MTETIESATLPRAMHDRYIHYALSVITSRALPDVRDGLKPVQRRILYCMEAILGLRADARFMKCAAVVGRVMGDYHPHGDQAIYDALVRLAQDFSLRYPLVRGEGNFGALSGDPPAAFRYTECRLQPLASELMSLLGEETVPFRPSFDNRNEEPVVLPAPAPFLLANGVTGIAVGMATNIPPHNLAEVCRAAAHLVDEDKATVAQLMKHVKGPDFPTGGEVVTKRDELRKIYEEGKGTFRLRGTWKLEEGARGARRFVVTSIPYGATIDELILRIKEIIDGRKIPHALSVNDETNDKEGVRIAIEMKKDADPDQLAAYLYKHTPLQANYAVNMTCLIPTQNPLVGAPAVLDLKSILRQFLDFRFEVVTKSLEFRLRKVRERIHILEGFIAIYDDLDNAIKLIRKADDKADAAAKLMKKYGLDEVQVDAILELRLYRLAQLEVKEIKEELSAKKADEDRLKKLLKGTKPRWDMIKKELLAFADSHDDKRRTRLIFSDDDVVYDETAYIVKEDTNVVVTRLGFLKRVRSLKDPSATRVREDDAVGWVVQGSTLAPGVYFSNRGSAYVSKLVDAPATTGYGDPVQKLFKFGDGEKLVGALSLDPRLAPPDEKPKKPDDVPPPHLLVVTAQGMVLRTPLAPHREVSTRAGRKYARTGEGDEVVAVELLAPNAKTVALFTNMGYAHRIPVEEVPLLSGVGKGLRGMKLEKNDRVVAATARSSIRLETTRGAQQEIEQKSLEVGERGKAGTVVMQRGGFTRELQEPELKELTPEDSKDGSK
jgi:DNA gyrase subunit A